MAVFRDKDSQTLAWRILEAGQDVIENILNLRKCAVAEGREEAAKICDKVAEEKSDVLRTVTHPGEFAAADAQSFIARQLAKQIRERKS